MSELYIGLMSGTSMDGIDAALLEIDESTCQLLCTHQQPFAAELKNKLQSLITKPSCVSLDMVGSCDTALGKAFADASIQLLEKANIPASKISAIGSHGQTIRHQANIEQAFSMQIGDANQIAYRTGICTISDFRRKDMAAGGQGAPLAPAFHQAFFSSSQENRAILNIGGIANLSYLPMDKNQACLGFDCGPGNTLMDAWIQKKQQQNYDRDGAWAASSSPHKELLKKLMQDTFISQLPPKSTGREHYHLNWLEQQLSLFTDIPDNQVQASLCAFTALSIHYAIVHFLPQVDSLIICGGGAHNQHLIQLLDKQLSGIKIQTSDAIGIAPDWVEAAAFAWLAYQTLHQHSGNLPAVTGASRKVTLGAIYTAN